jgi:gamma-glutamylcyclotransferase (GGCT)/AIG2-like uncharacterized protein YtfP
MAESIGTTHSCETRLFAYGTLMDASVLQSIIGRVLPCQPAVLQGYRRCRVLGEDFPALRPAPEFSCQGLLLERIRDGDWRRMDSYEGLCYSRESVEVQTAAGPLVSCQVYVWKPDFQILLLAEEWHP